MHVSVRLGQDDRLYLQVVIGVREDGTKELLAVEDGYRESAESWAGVMRDLKARGINEPKLVVGDGALGTWAALRDVFPGARRQACWVHMIARVLDTLPKRRQPDARSCCTRSWRPRAARLSHGKGPGRFVILATGQHVEPWMSVYPDSGKVSGPEGILLQSSAVG